MRKALTYFSFATASLVVILAFVTAKTYTQLGIAVALYPLLAFFAFKIFPISTSVHLNKPIEKQQPAPVNEPKSDEPVVVDIDRRAFLKLIGGTGLSIFIFSLLGRRFENFLFDRSLGSGTALNNYPAQNENNTVQASPTEGYNISEIDEGIVTYYGFINNTGGWLIMKEDTDTSSFRYAKGNSNFPKNWNSREILKYDYFHNLF